MVSAEVLVAIIGVLVAVPCTVVVVWKFARSSGDRQHHSCEEAQLAHALR
jgi:hypothetical protein